MQEEDSKQGVIVGSKVRQDLFLHVTSSLRYGSAQEELSEKLNECVNRARVTGKQATLTLKLVIKPNGNSGQYTLIDTITSSIPEMDKGATLMFGTPDGNLTRHAPNQDDMFRQRVIEEKLEARRVAEEEQQAQRVN